MNSSAFLFSVVLSLALALFQCQRPDGVDLKQATPAATLNTLFALARAEQVAPLAGLCDPQARNDGDTDCLCALSPDYQPHSCPTHSPNRIPPAAFFKCFARAEVRGEIVYRSETVAEVPFRASQQHCGFASETMRLIYVKQRWYLESF